MFVLLYCLFFFFFQAEDGIRDHCVTGVQTCALPIAFLNTAMLLGGMGPVDPLRTNGGKVFAGVFALYAGMVFLVVAGALFLGVGTLIFALFFIQKGVGGLGVFFFARAARVLSLPLN